MKANILFAILLIITIEAWPQTGASNFVAALELEPLQTEQDGTLTFTSELKASIPQSCDWFVLTFQLNSNFVEEEHENILALKRNDEDILTFGIKRFSPSDVTTGALWIVSRPLYINGHQKTIKYRIYDRVSAYGTISLFISRYFLGIARDVADGKWEFSPLLFGVDSNTNYASSLLTGNNMDSFLNKVSTAVGTISLVSQTVTNLKIWIDTEPAEQLIVQLGGTDARNHVVNARSAPAPHIVTGTEYPESSEAGSYGVYPNPVTNRVLNVSGAFKNGEVIEYVVFDLAGRKIASEKLTAAGSEVTIPLPNEVQQGMFLLQVHSNSTGKRKQLFYVQ